MREMGDDNKILLKGKPIFWILIAALCLISVIEVFSATSRMTFGGSQNYLKPVIGHVIHLGIGLFCLYIVHRIPYRYFKIIPYVLLPLAAVALIYLLVKNHAAGGSGQRWIALPGFSLQPSELAKMGVLVAVSSILSRQDRSDEMSQLRTFIRILVLTSFFVLLIIPENLSTAVLLAGVVFLMMIVGRVRAKYMILLSAIGGGLIVLVLILMVKIPPARVDTMPLPERFKTWQARVLDFIDKSEELSAKAYVMQIARDKPQETHANIAIATSNIFGKGPGNSVERDFLQEASCDFIYAIIIEELGLLGAVVVMFIYLWILLKIGGVAASCGERKFPRYLAMGVGFMMMMQALVNMAVAVGLIPVTGQPLPLISTGGTSILVTCVYFGMLLSISWSAVDQPSEIAVGEGSGESSETNVESV